VPLSAIGVASGVSATIPPAPMPTKTWSSPSRTSAIRSRVPIDTWSSTAMSPEPCGSAALKRFKSQLIARISATIAIRLKASCARLPTDSGETDGVVPITLHAPCVPSR